MQAALKYLVTPKCETAILAGALPASCLKQVVTNSANLGILLGALTVKLPQILKILAAKSVSGISESSLALELLSATAACLYARLMGFPFSSWGEMFFISVQCLILNMLYWAFGQRVSIMNRLIALITYAAGVWYILNHQIPPYYVTLLASLPISLNMLSRVPQILLNFKTGHTGQLSLITFGLAFAGNVARVLTTLGQLNDPVTLASHLTAALLNGTLVAQIFFYKQDRSKKQQ